MRIKGAKTFYFPVVNLVPRAHVPFGQRQDTELWNNRFPETKILGLPASRRMRGLVNIWRLEIKSMWICSSKAFNTHWKDYGSRNLALKA